MENLMGTYQNPKISKHFCISTMNIYSDPNFIVCMHNIEGQLSYITFRTSSRVAETPGFVGIKSLDPNTVDKLGEWDILSSFELCSDLLKHGELVML